MTNSNHSAETIRALPQIQRRASSEHSLILALRAANGAPVSLAVLKRATGFSVPSLSTALKKMAQRGEVTIRRFRHVEGGHASNAYELSASMKSTLGMSATGGNDAI